MGLLSGKVAVVTGGGRGIGRAEALLFAREGARVLVNDTGVARDGSRTSEDPAADVVREIREAGGEAVANRDTVATRAGAEAIVAAAIEAFGRLDVLLCNAGILRDRSLLKMDEDLFDEVIAVHLRGTFLCAQAAARRMIAQGEGGRIVTTTSLSGMLGNFGQANYAAAKAGVYGLTRTLAVELQKHRIRANALAPVARTRLTEDLPMFDGVETLSPAHVAPAALFLASDLSGDRTGHVLAVAGSRLYVFKVVESEGRFKESTGGVWSAEEIADNWEGISKV